MELLETISGGFLLSPIEKKAGEKRHGLLLSPTEEVKASDAIADIKTVNEEIFVSFFLS